MHNLLETQIEQHLGRSISTDPGVRALLEAVSKTYEEFEQRRAQIEKTLTQSATELKDVITLLDATLNTTHDGILVVDTAGNILHHNKRFLDVLELTEDAVRGRDGNQVFALIHAKSMNGELVAQKTQVFSGDPEHESSDTILLKDGRIIERHSQPHRVGGALHGRVWSVRDITKRIAAENQLKMEIRALERLNRTMVDRELRMVELKEKIKVLEEKVRTFEHTVHVAHG